MDAQSRDSEESLTSATESELVAQVNKLSTAILGTNSNVTMLNERLTQYQRTHEEALRELQKSLMSPRFHDSTSEMRKRCCTSLTCDDQSPIKSLVSLLGEKDLSVSVLREENGSLREELERLKSELSISRSETCTEKETLKRWQRMVQRQLAINLDSVNRLIRKDPSIPAPVRRALLAERHPQQDFILQQAELTSKLQWLCEDPHSTTGGDPHCQ